MTAFPAETAVLDAAERDMGFIINRGMVEVGHASLQVLGKKHHLVHIIGHNRR